MREEIVETEDIYKGRLVHLQSHTVRLPDGTQAAREVIQHPGAAAVLVLNNADDVLLVEQYRTAAQQMTYEIPAGVLEPGEDPAHCARRELQEETGYAPQQLQSLGGIYVAPAYTTEYIHLFYTRQVEHNPLPQDDDEFVRALWLPFADALAMVETGDITEAKTVVALLRVARLLEK